jgi:hypothetical protein
LGGRELRGIGDQPADLLGCPFPREDDMEEAQAADQEPAGIDKAVPGAAVGLRDDQGLSAAPAKEIAPIAPRLELPAGLQEVAIAFERGGKTEASLVTGLDHGRTEIIGIKQDQNLDPGGGVELPSGVFMEGNADGRTRLFFT